MSAMEHVERWMRQSGEISDRVVAAIDVLPADKVREIAKLYAENVGYLGDHFPTEREGIAPFACSGNTYHYCSFMAVHDPGCPAVGGDGSLARDGGRPCTPECGETDERPWCHVNGFDCPDCEFVDKLLAILVTA